MATSPEKRIEAALITQISALTYITANSISVRADDDMTKEKAAAFVNVAVPKAGRLMPNYSYYKTSVEISCVTHIPNDEADAVSEELYDEVNDWMQGLTAADINTTLSDAEVTIDGLVPTQNEDDYEENMRVYVVAFDCFYTLVTLAETLTMTFSSSSNLDPVITGPSTVRWVGPGGQVSVGSAPSPALAASGQWTVQVNDRSDITSIVANDDTLTEIDVSAVDSVGTLTLTDNAGLAVDDVVSDMLATYGARVDATVLMAGTCPNVTADSVSNIAAMPNDSWTYNYTAPAWTPADITTYAGYAGDQTGQADGALAQWDDIGTTAARHLVQATGDDQPTLASSVVTLDGVSEYMETASTYDLSAGFSIISAFSQSTTSLSQRPFGVQGGSGAKKNFAFDSDNSLRYDGAVSTGGVAATTGKHIRVATKSADADVQNGWIDGSVNITDTENINPSDVVSISVGKVAATAVFFTGDMYESWIVAGVIDTDTRQKFEGYLAWKWDGINGDTALVGLLPAGHPFKLAPPTV